MKYQAAVKTAQAELLAAVRVTVPISDIARACKPALDQVLAFLKANGELRPGHNLFLYHHPERRHEPMYIDFGVQVAGRFEPEGNVHALRGLRGQTVLHVHEETGSICLGEDEADKC